MLPCTPEVLEKNGWKFVSPLELGTLNEQGENVFTWVINNKEQTLNIVLTNPYAKPTSFKDCFVTAISQHIPTMEEWLKRDKDKLVDFEICGIKSYKSTREDVSKVLNKYFGEYNLTSFDGDWEEMYYFGDLDSVSGYIRLLGVNGNLSRSAFSNRLRDKTKYVGKAIDFNYSYMGNMYDTK